MRNVRNLLCHCFSWKKCPQFGNKILYFSLSIKGMNLLVRLVRYLYFQCHFVSEVAGDNHRLLTTNDSSGGIHGNPGSRNHPKGDFSPGAWKMEGPEVRVTWNLQFPSGPKHLAPNSERDKEWHTPDQADGPLILQVETVKELWSRSRKQALRGIVGDQQNLEPLLSKMEQEPQRVSYLVRKQACHAGQNA